MRAPKFGTYLALALLAAALLFAALLAGCAQEDSPPAGAAGALGPDASLPGDAGPTGPKLCTQTRAEPLPARLTAMSTHASSGAEVVLVGDLYSQFVSNCGKCHGALNSMGSFQIATASDFTLKYIKDQNVVSHITSEIACPFAEDPNNVHEPMPPCGEPNAKPFSQRSTNDPVYGFEKLLEQWIAMGGPMSFIPASTDSSSGGDAGPPVSLFAMTPANGNAMTNLGNCVPSKALVAVEQTKSAALDAMFAKATSKPGGSAAEAIGLPEKLSETDLFTLDSQTLAQYGVIAYAPGYPLWSDDAGKLRYVRVPRGTSIHFNKDTQTFEIPPNTRFYKTFMKLVADTDGSLRYRKIETRLIVARPDTNNADGTAAAQTALFGTYKWSADESEATLFENLLYNGQPFPDDVISYHTDEQLAASILASQPTLPEEALLEKHALRHYAIPSSTRCIQCHMGSPTKDFVLGFNPLQINRRATGTGGTIADHGAEAGPDEINQLQRFIDYGVITGIDEVSDVLPLEQSQGTRAPRNDYELKAQGYLLGNCAHCHNPRGYPTSIQPLLSNLLNFLPSATGGGVFQFPLESYSPDIFRGVTGTTQIPFITPSLMDHPRTDLAGKPVADPFFATAQAGDVEFTTTYAMFAPWRSLIYRNVASAFTYSDDVTLYPHMPMNTPGYDPRAKQILSDWMVSIPAVRKNPEIPEYAFNHSDTPLAVPSVDTNEQPYVEVLPGDPRFEAARNAAKLRVDILEGNAPNKAIPQPTLPYNPYQDPGNTGDILDPNVELNPTCHQTPTTGVESLATDASTPNHLPVFFIDTPHWVTTDLTQLLGYTPRRSDWATYLVKGATPAQAPSCVTANEQAAAYQDQLAAIQLVQTASLDATFRTFASAKRPMGIWKAKAGCTYPGQKPVSAYTAMPPDTDGVRWLRDPTNHLDPTAPVYEETPGAEVFKMICINCHGKRADSNGFIAQNLALLTGGLARVADFHDGIFGPAQSPGANLESAFGTAAVKAAVPAAGPNWTGVTADDRAARYMVWMALGGTQVIIPTSVLSVVGTTPVFGVPQSVGASSANMLAVAKARCASQLGYTTKQLVSGRGFLESELDPLLLSSNGDAELWLRMCTVSNPPPVHVIAWNQGVPKDQQAYTSLGLDFRQIPPSAGFIQPEFYAQNATSVGDEHGQIVPISPGAPGAAPVGWPKWPYCISLAAGDTGPPPGPGWPLCPKAVSDVVVSCRQDPTSFPKACYTEADGNRWAVHGALNAGFSVYLYLKDLQTMAEPPPDYTDCEKLK